MNTATITEAKNGLSGLIDRVRAGERIVITDRGIPVARLEPVSASSDASGRLRRLERSGAVRVGVAAPPLDRISRPGPRLPSGVSAVETLLDERNSGR